MSNSLSVVLPPVRRTFSHPIDSGCRFFLIVSLLGTVGCSSGSVSYPIINEFGQSIPNVYSGAGKVRPELVTAVMNVERSSRGKRDASSAINIVNRLEALAGVATVKAMACENCTPTGCYGTHYVQETRDCAPACEGLFWYFSFSNPPTGPINRGWKYSGGWHCGSNCCVCAEELCDY